jgi:cell fate regulator YaaT (PSP1 superfamily)
MSQTLLVRYGIVPEVARFRAGDGPWEHGARVVVRTHRGVELGTVLQVVKSTGSNGHNGQPDESEQHVLRGATADDDGELRRLQAECAAEFSTWQRRIADWNLELELIDLEWLLDRSKLVLYVLNDRGSDCTKLAIYAAAEGLAPVEVQPVNANGLVQLEPAGGGCGTGGGCGSCGT